MTGPEWICPTAATGISVLAAGRHCVASVATSSAAGRASSGRSSLRNDSEIFHNNANGDAATPALARSARSRGGHRGACSPDSRLGRRERRRRSMPDNGRISSRTPRSVYPPTATTAITRRGREGPRPGDQGSPPGRSIAARPRQTPCILLYPA